MARWNIVHDHHFQGHGVTPRHLFIDFSNSLTQKHKYRHQDYISSSTLWKMVWPKLQQSVALEATLSVDSWLILSGVA